jgi:hypothetical protein
MTDNLYEIQFWCILYALIKAAQEVTNILSEIRVKLWQKAKGTENGHGHQWRTEGGLGGSTPPKFRSFDEAEPNSQFHGKYIHNNLLRIQVSL